jgi:ATP-binding cassette subfamily F protein 3
LLPIASLSGGEKARVALAMFVCNPYDVLLLDEPTNHLDLVTIEVLADALVAFDGAIAFVTHDRHFVERVATHVVHVGVEPCAVRAGVRADDFEPRTLTRESTIEQGSGGVDHAERKRRQRDRDRKVRRVEAIQSEIEALEGKMQRIDEQLVEVATNYARAAALAAERDGLEAKHTALFEEWSQLDADLASG